ncbi:uncharacterized protein LOC123877815 [Maniola jurtina]|uniref:uncharacterized protein LOC123877815 n=1 Tax=Maniola jurtina TaxID=191418 RepID=UPI001E68CB1B|nr:uncharacterized protein LOC123877815 [Maniola jurtina]
MASRKIEDVHKLLLDKLLSDSGLECPRSAPESVESSTLSVEIEEQGPYQEEQEQIKEDLIEEETLAPITEEPLQEQPEIFPTPSLRRLVPDRIRKYEEHNRIHVLPEEFRTDIDPDLIPKIASTAQQKYIDMLGELTGCVMYKQSLAEYWFLDTLANLLRRAQEDDMSRSSQAMLVQWFCEWMKEMQHFDAADRERMLKRFKDNMLSAARYIAEEQMLPTPQAADVHYKAQEPVGGSSYPARDLESKHLVTFEGAAYECSLRDLTSIIHYIFDLFSTDYQFNLVRAIFTSSPGYTLIDIPFQLCNPKRLFVPLKLKPRKEPKKEKPAKGKKKEVYTEEYLALLELRARDEREQNEREDRDQEEWHRRNHILPLQLAAGEELFNKYWPPPTPEPEPEPEPENKGRGKGKGKGKK